MSFGFFGDMECDLVIVSDSSRLHEYEIKRSWSDFLADFRKKRFHDDLRICNLTFVVPSAFACDDLKVWCEKHHGEWRREFDFMRDAPYRRRMFTEELCRLYRLGTIRLWHGWNADDKGGKE